MSLLSIFFFSLSLSVYMCQCLSNLSFSNCIFLLSLSVYLYFISLALFLAHTHTHTPFRPPCLRGRGPRRESPTSQPLQSGKGKGVFITGSCSFRPEKKHI
jgi:hypothetical protein